jgi:hypothetical protein
MHSTWTLKFNDDLLDTEFNRWLLVTNAYFYTLFLRVAVGCNLIMIGYKIFQALTDEKGEEFSFVIIGLNAFMILILLAGIWVNKKN